MKTYKLNPEYLPQNLENMNKIDALVEGSVDVADAMQLGEEGTALEIREELKDLHAKDAAKDLAITDQIVREMIDKDILVETEDLSPAHEQDCREAIVSALTDRLSMSVAELRVATRFDNLLIDATLRHLVLSNIVTRTEYDNPDVVTYSID